MDRPSFITEELLDRLADELIRNPSQEFACALAALGMGPEGNGMASQLLGYIAEHVGFNDRQLKLLEKYGVTLPSKEVIAFEILSAARLAIKNASAQERTFALTAYRLFAEITGAIVKGGPQVNVQVNNVDKRVMVIPASKSLDDWEASAIAQQSNLIADAREKV